MTVWVSLDGVIRDEVEASIPVTDRGFLYGDSVYEVVRTYGGRPHLFSEHLERLRRSADQIGLHLPGGLEPIAADVLRTLEQADHAESCCTPRPDLHLSPNPEVARDASSVAAPMPRYVRIIVTRGSGPIALDPNTADRPRRVVIVAPLVPYPEALYREGALVCLVPTGRGDSGLLAGAKSGNYLVNVLALGEAKRHGAHEAILLDHQGRITEGASSNIFMLRQGALVTPPLDAGILEGITRRQIVALARDSGLEVREEPMVPGDLRQAEEVFLTSTLREVLPVTHIREVSGALWPVEQGAPGPVTQRLHRAYLRAVETTAQRGPRSHRR